MIPEMHFFEILRASFFVNFGFINFGTFADLLVLLVMMLFIYLFLSPPTWIVTPFTGETFCSSSGLR